MSAYPSLRVEGRVSVLLSGGSEGRVMSWRQRWDACKWPGIRGMLLASRCVALVSVVGVLVMIWRIETCKLFDEGDTRRHTAPASYTPSNASLLTMYVRIV